jgi:hypothetical protein
VFVDGNLLKKLRLRFLLLQMSQRYVSLGQDFVHKQTNFLEIVALNRLGEEEYLKSYSIEHVVHEIRGLQHELSVLSMLMN